MKQLAMKATISKIPVKQIKLPLGYKFVNYSYNDEELSSWKKIVVEPPVPPFTGDEYWDFAIKGYPDLVQDKDIWLIKNPNNQTIATLTTITHADGTGYLHMVKMFMSERGKGIGQAMANFSIEEFRKRGINEVYLTTDDFRIPAIKTYLKSGYLPIIYTDPESDMLARWDKIFNDINYPKTEYVFEEYREYGEIENEEN